MKRRQGKEERKNIIGIVRDEKGFLSGFMLLLWQLMLNDNSLNLNQFKQV